MQSAWMQDLNNSILHRSAVIAHHAQASRRIEMVQGDYEFVIMNYDGLNLTADEIANDGRFDLIIVDEANAYKNVSTKRWKALNRLIKPTTLLWMMTGTPASQSPLDAYGLAKLVNSDAVPRFYTAWRDKVMNKVSQFRWLAKSDAPEKVFDALQPAIRFTKEQCLDLPPVVTITREVPLTPQQAKYYMLLKERMVLQAAGETITAVNAAASVNKLLQISAGASYTDMQEVVEFDCAPRLSVLMEVLEETERKVLIFAPFRHSIDTITTFLKKNNVDCEEIHGDITATKRAAIFKRFQTEDSPRVLVIQPQSASHGVTLTAADTVVFWGPVMSVETYMQCCARTDRVGQTSDKVTVIHIQGSPIEKKMFTQLASRVEDHALLIKLYEEEVANDKKRK
jgi:SNF2 family DNA or RNA helicase